MSAERDALARDLHHAGVPGNLYLLADFLLERGWRQQPPSDPLLTERVDVAASQVIGGIPVAIVGKTVDGEPILGHADRLLQRDPRQRAEYLAASRAEAAMGGWR